MARQAPSMVIVSRGDFPLNWYAIQTAPGAFRQTTSRTVQAGPHGGRHMVCTTNAETAIEAELSRAGISFYIPFEPRQIIHHRTKKLMERRFPILPGYAFVEDVGDWPALEALQSVTAILGGMDGRPISIPASDVDKLRKVEELAVLAYFEERKRIAEARKKLTRKRAAGMYPKGSRVEVSHETLGHRVGSVIGATGRKTVKVMAEMLGGMVPIEVPVDSVRRVA